MCRSQFGLRPALALALAAGASLALQSRYNGELGAELDNPYLAAFVSCCVGTCLLLVLVFSSRRSTEDLRNAVRTLRERTFPLWALSGGFAGAFLVLAQSASIRSLGVTLFAVSSVAGQTIAGLILDRFGLGTGARTPIRPRRALGAILAVAAVIAAGFGLHQVSTMSWLVALPVIAGAGTGWQAAVNGRLRQATRSALTATLLNFCVGWVALLVVAGVALMFTGFPATWPAHPLPYAGGALGVAYVLLCTFVVRSTGVLLLGLATVAGQMIASVLLDVLAPVGPRPGLSLLVAVLVSLVAVITAATPEFGVKSDLRRPRRPPR